MNSALYHGAVMHHRLFPKQHRFVYKLSSWMIDIDELPSLDANIKGFGYNRSAVFSFHDADYGLGDGTPVREFINACLGDNDLPIPHSVKLLCQVRALGYLFNPLVVWFCYDEQGELYATLYEVRNTFKQRHHYLVKNDSNVIRQWHQAEKCFYVSPFMPMDCNYEFQFKAPTDRLAFKIRQTNADKVIMNAVWTGKREQLTQTALLKQMISNPISGVKIIAAIHWEALRLWIKGMRLVKRPEPPVEPMSKGKVITSPITNKK